MNILTSVLYYFKQFTSTISGFAVLLVSWIIALSSIQKGMLVLTIAVILDFISGCIASWIEHRRNNTSISVYFFESSKMRLSVLKMLSYCMFIFFAWTLTELFFDKGLGLPGSSKTFAVTEIVTGVCIAIEIWSNLENLKRSGFDVFGIIKKASSQVWSIIKAVKNES